MNISQVDQSTHGNHAINEIEIANFVSHHFVKNGSTGIGRLQIDIGTGFDEHFDQFFGLGNQSVQIKPILATKSNGVEEITALQAVIHGPSKNGDKSK